jgi:hypothetical protein
MKRGLISLLLLFFLPLLPHSLFVKMEGKFRAYLLILKRENLSL